MLKMIKCDKFLQKEIIFHKGLNSVVGDDVASNSIGKTTLLMVIDFVFGGNDYILKNSDTVENLGHHEFFFSFEFNREIYNFIRGTESYKEVIICDKEFKKVEIKSISDFCLWLQEKYNCELEDLSFRSIVGRYFRIYGKENLNEKKPIQYFEKEKANESILNLIKLFNKYSVLKSCEIELANLKESKKILSDAGKKEIILAPHNKTSYKLNEKRIAELSTELESLKKDIINQSTNLESLMSKEILDLQQEKSKLNTRKNMLYSRLRRTRMNIEKKKSKIHLELDGFVHYFPNFNVEQVEKVDNFHNNITEILKKELSVAEKELSDKISLIDEQLISISRKIENTLNIKNAPKLSVERLVDLTTNINELNEQNRYYNKKDKLVAGIKETNSDYGILKVQVTDDICNQINESISILNKQIYTDGRRTPAFNIHDDRYTFNTYGDTGTGTAFASLISFDLSILELTCLPALIHDLPLLKNIENLALENIFELYSRTAKQIFIAIDKLNSYSKESKETIENSAVLQLTKEKLLFVKNWKKQ